MGINLSSELVLAEVKRELDKQMSHFESLDGKAGLLLGSAGILVALPGLTVSLPALMLRGLSACAALAAIASFWPRFIRSSRGLRNRYLSSESAFTRLYVLDTQIEMIERASALLKAKALWLKISILFLVAAVTISFLLLAFGYGGRS